ncbi:DinB family protein [Deinococcus alpinitundrae]|uniref:DinB family protein n=1 Tax=Deinococcus alpinitundrae TaxID=468913 RepID=UPI001379DD45|nr:DinB family protein [Deinococcus alpinitundrae]
MKLRELVAETVPRLQAVSEERASFKPAEGVWSAKQVLGHLIDSGVNNHARFIRAAAESGLELPGYDQNVWVRLGGWQDQTWAEVLGLWDSYQTALGDLIDRLLPGALSHTLSVGGGAPVTLGWLTEDYVQHQQHHLAQIWERAEV